MAASELVPSKWKIYSVRLDIVLHSFAAIVYLYCIFSIWTDFVSFCEVKCSQSGLSIQYFLLFLTQSILIPGSKIVVNEPIVELK